MTTPPAAASTDARPARPAAVVVVAVLAILAAVLNLVGGIALLIAGADAAGVTGTEAAIWGVVLMIAGAIYLAVGVGLLRLSSLALLVGLVVSGLKVVFAIVWLLAIGFDGIGWTGAIDLAFWALVFASLWVNRGVFDRS